MKKIFILFISLLLVGMFVGCDETTETGSNQAIPLQSFEETGTVQGTVFDAVTGARIGDSSLKVTLIKGSTYASPAVLKNSSTDTTFLGDFAFNDVPVTQGGVATYRIVAEMAGYQTFEGYINIAVGMVAVTGSGIIDEVYNFVRNIYMYPVGSYASDQYIYVYYDNEPVSGATVLLEHLPFGNTPITTPTGTVVTAPATAGNTPITVQPAANGLSQSLIATTDANGLATFLGSTLVLGGSYPVTVLPLKYEGVQLAINTGTAIIVGASGNINVQVVNMTDEVPGVNNEGLYVVSATPQDPEDILSSGVLTITFNRAIEIVSEQAFTATLSGTATTGTLTGDNTNTAVAATVSTDGLVLTLTPVFTTAIVPYSAATGPSGTNTADISTSITYTGGQITLLNDDESVTYNILQGGADGVIDINGNNVTQTVNLTGPTTD